MTRAQVVEAADAQPRFERFAHAGVVVQGWYALGRSSAFPTGRVRAAEVGGRPLAVWRDASGALHAVDGACGHLGADLARGTVTAGGLVCPFHGWCWSGDGSCASGPGEGRRTGAYPVVARWGLVWAWTGDRPWHALPEGRADARRVLSLRPQTIPVHPHLVLANGFDAAHYRAAHDADLEAAPAWSVEPPGVVRLRARARLRPTLVRRLGGLARRVVDVEFTSHGATIAWADVRAPFPFSALFTAKPDAEGRAVTSTVLFLPRGTSALRALAVVAATTWEDRAILSTLRFRPGFAPGDEAFAEYARLVEAMPTW